MQLRRIEVASARWDRNSVGRGRAGGEKAGKPGASQWQRNTWVRGGGWWRQGKGWQNPSSGHVAGSRDPWTGSVCAGGEAASGSNDPWNAGAWTIASWEGWQ